MILYEFARTRSYKCRWLIKELGIDCEFQTVDLTKGEHLESSYLQINPFGKVPALVDGDLRLHEATAICIYLADHYGEGTLISEPRSRERALLDQWLFFMSNELECHLWCMEKNTWGYPEEKRSELAIEMSGQDFRKAALIVDEQLQGKDFLVGGRFTVADVSLAYLLRWADARELLDGLENLRRHLDSMMSRDAYPSELFES